MSLKAKKLWIVVSLLLLTAAAYWQAISLDFVNYDDPAYVTENDIVQNGLTADGVRWSFTTVYIGNWHPLTWLSHMLDIQIFGLNPAGHHFGNLLFHIANTLLLFLLLLRMTKAPWQSAFAAALFALHPLHVESFAWISERKDVLSTFFLILTIGAYVLYVEKPRLPRYGCVVILFLLGLMAKPMLVTLPFLLLLLDFWPLGRLQPPGQAGVSREPAGRPATPGKRKSKVARPRRAAAPSVEASLPLALPWPRIRGFVLEKIPLFALSALFSVITFVTQHGEGSVSSLEAMPLGFRIANSLLSYARYMGKMIWPDHLAVFYPYPKVLPLWLVIGAALLLIGITWAAARSAGRFPWLIVGWLWYLGTLVPVIGIVAVGSQAMADRYTYVPLVGLFIMIAWGAPELLKRVRGKEPILAVAAGAAIAALMAVTWSQLSHWQNGVSLFRHTLAVTSDNSTAHDLMGSALRRTGDTEGALAHFSEAIRINPANAKAHDHLGNILADRGRTDEAVAHYLDAVRFNPRDEIFRNNLGKAYFEQGKIDEAIREIRTALDLKPDFAEARYNLGSILGSQGKHAEAMAHFREALRKRPGWAQLHNNLGSALLLQGNVDEAIAHFREALRIQPDYPTAQANLRDAMSLRKGP